MRMLGPAAIALSILAALAALAAVPAGATRSDVLQPGTHTTTSFQPALTYTVPAGWNNFCDEPGAVCFTPPGGNPNGVDNGKSDYVDVFTSVANSAGGGCPADRPGPIHTPRAFAGWLRHLKSLAVSRPAAVTLGGLSGYVVDVRMRKGWRKLCPGFKPPPYVETLTGRGPSPSGLSHGIGPRPELQRLYLLGYRGGTLAVELLALKGPAALRAYAQVVETFTFAR